MRREARTVRYGKFLADFYNNFLMLIPDDEREKYKRELVEELSKYSDIPRRKGEPRNSGCASELEGIEDFDLYNPKHLAKLIKEGLHLMYQKQTSKRVLDSLLENLK